MKSLPFSLTFLAFGICAIYAQPANLQMVYLPTLVAECEDDKPWTLVFHDEFSGTEIDTQKWFTYFPVAATYPYLDKPYARTHDAGGKANDDKGSLQVFLDENAVVKEGELRLIGEEIPTTWMGETYPFRSGMIHGRRHWSTPHDNASPTPDFLYGKFEIRCKLPAADWWPSFWLWGRCNDEIDVFEVFPKHSEDFQTNVRTHRESRNGQVVCSQDHDYVTDAGIIQDDSKDFIEPTIRTAYHTFAVEWSPYEINFFFNEEKIETQYRFLHLTDSSGIACGEAIRAGLYFDNLNFVRTRMILLATNGLSDQWGDKEVGPNDEMRIDYIRAWQKSPEPKFSDCEVRRITGPKSIFSGGGTASFRLEGENTHVTWRAGPNLQIDSTAIDPLTGFETIHVSTTDSLYAGPAVIWADAWSHFCAFRSFRYDITIRKADSEE